MWAETPDEELDEHLREGGGREREAEAYALCVCIVSAVFIHIYIYIYNLRFSQTRRTAAFPPTNLLSPTTITTAGTLKLTTALTSVVTYSSRKGWLWRSPQGEVYTSG